MTAAMDRDCDIHQQTNPALPRAGRCGATSLS